VFIRLWSVKESLNAFLCLWNVGGTVPAANHAISFYAIVCSSLICKSHSFPPCAVYPLCYPSLASLFAPFVNFLSSSGTHHCFFSVLSGHHCGGDGSVVTSCSSSRPTVLFSFTFCNSCRRVTMWMHDAQMCSCMHVVTGAPDYLSILHCARLCGSVVFCSSKLFSCKPCWVVLFLGTV
jgi:hypothetical protein